MAHRRGGFAKKIDTVHWTFGSFQATSLAGTGTAGVTVFPAQHLPETILRMRGEYAAGIEGATGPDVGARLTMGLILVPEGTGTSVLWSPETDGDAPWIWWDVMHLLYDEYVVDVLASAQTPDGRRVIDSKAMRKIRNTELQFVAENQAITGFTSATVNVAGAVRGLTGS